jgi:hypothetical protein
MITDVPMARNRRPTITPVVMSYEDTIRKNRQAGHDRDLLGHKSTLPSPFKPDVIARRASETITFSNLRRQQQQQRQHGELQVPALRRATLMDAMSVTSDRRLRTTTTEPPCRLNSRKEPSQGRVVTSSTKKEITLLTKDTATTNAPKNVDANQPYAAPNQVPALPKEKTPDPPAKEDFEDDEEMQTLQRQINELKNKLQQVQALEAGQIQAHQDKAKAEKERYYKRQMSHVILPVAGSDRKLSQQAEKQHKLIDQLRLSNKALRGDCQQLSVKIIFLLASRTNLEMVQSITLEYTDKLSTFHDSEQELLRKVSSHVPKYREKVQELDEESQHRSSWITMERRVLAKYELCQSAILYMMEERSDDADLVEELVSTSLGLVNDE